MLNIALRYTPDVPESSLVNFYALLIVITAYDKNSSQRLKESLMKKITEFIAKIPLSVKLLICFSLLYVFCIFGFMLRTSDFTYAEF